MIFVNRVEPWIETGIRDGVGARTERFRACVVIESPARENTDIYFLGHRPGQNVVVQIKDADRTPSRFGQVVSDKLRIADVVWPKSRPAL